MGNCPRFQLPDNIKLFAEGVILDRREPDQVIYMACCDFVRRPRQIDR